ncbi:MAG: PmoA family protein [Bryobacterales bacterium]|nr:PmoA family protein [Bryobacterales bacterium]
MLSRRSYLRFSAVAAASGAIFPNLFAQAEANSEVRFFSGSRPLFTYRYSKDRPKPYIHPIYAPDGTAVTQDGPHDHIHHRGLMLAWSGVDGIDFWGETNPARHGSLVHVKFERKSKTRLTSLIHWNAEGRLLLVESRTISAPKQPPDITLLDWDSTLSAPAKVQLGTAGHEYNGLGVRVAESMDLGEVLNSNGTASIAKANGEPANWCVYTGKLGQGTASIAIFDHAGNPRHPTPYFVMNDKFGYMSAAPTFREDLFLAKGERIRFRWRVAVWQGAKTREEIDQLYKAWEGGRA